MNKKISLKIILLTFICCFFSSQINNSAFEQSSRFLANTPPKFQLGNEVLLSSGLDKLKDKNIGLITNQTGVLPDGTHILDALLEKGIKVVKIFSPEHGIRGDENYAAIDVNTGITIVSLYGEKVKPSKEDLEDIDILIYDIQDIGARFYTYTSTLYYAIESAIENNKKFIICDRPIIINPYYVDGFLLENAYQSFVGKLPTPISYGLTCGELAGYLNAKLYSSSSLIEVIKMKNYTRLMDYNSLKLAWVKPSPNIFYPSSAVCYMATCFLEGTNASEGRGTDKPFEYVGAPWCNSNELAEELNSHNLNGVTFEPITFTPSERMVLIEPKFFYKECHGVFIHVLDKNQFEPVKTGITILYSLHKLYKVFKFNPDNYIDKLAGTDILRTKILLGREYFTIINSWKDAVDNYKFEIDKYLFYR